MTFLNRMAAQILLYYDTRSHACKLFYDFIVCTNSCYDVTVREGRPGQVYRCRSRRSLLNSCYLTAKLHELWLGSFSSCVRLRLYNKFLNFIRVWIILIYEDWISCFFSKLFLFNRLKYSKTTVLRIFSIKFLLADIIINIFFLTT